MVLPRKLQPPACFDFRNRTGSRAIVLNSAEINGLPGHAARISWNICVEYLPLKSRADISACGLVELIHLAKILKKYSLLPRNFCLIVRQSNGGLKNENSCIRHNIVFDGVGLRSCKAKC